MGEGSWQALCETLGSGRGSGTEFGSVCTGIEDGGCSLFTSSESRNRRMAAAGCGGAIARPAGGTVWPGWSGGWPACACGGCTDGGEVSVGAECCSITGCRLDAVAAPRGGEDTSGGGRDPAQATHRGLALGSDRRANFESVKISAAEAKGKAVSQRGRENPPFSRVGGGWGSR